MLALLVALSGPTAPPPPIWWGGRVLTLHNVHIGVRPFLYVAPDEWALGASFQITTRAL